jgi:hypothetical protein
MKSYEEDWNELEDLVFAAITPLDVHELMADWGGISYPSFVEAIGLFLRLQEKRKAETKKLTLDEMTLVQNCGTYTLQ